MGKSVPDRFIRVIFANGKKYQNFEGDGSAELEIVFKTRSAQWSLIFEGINGLFESYVSQEIDLNGKRPVHSLADIGIRAGFGELSVPNPFSTLKQVRYEHRISNRNFKQARLNAIAHYNLPGEFFRIVLGETYGYCEGYYRNGYEGDDSQAQHDRFDLVCKKLLLKPGDKLVEVGSAWGYMSVLAAEKYGADVVNYGIVPEQNRVMEKMIVDKGLSHKVTVVDRDHRDLVNEPGKYDKYVSLGVYEHAGRGQVEDWIKSISACLKPGGVGVLAAMFEMQDTQTNYLTSKYIFPGGDIPSLPKTLALMDKYGLTVLDMENLWHHYQRAIDYWAANFRENWEKIRVIDPQRFNERFRRIWTMYLEGCGFAFSEGWGRINTFHITFTKGRKPEYYPATREFLYQEKEVTPGR